VTLFKVWTFRVPAVPPSALVHYLKHYGTPLQKVNQKAEQIR